MQKELLLYLDEPKFNGKSNNKQQVTMNCCLLEWAAQVQLLIIALHDPTKVHMNVGRLFIVQAKNGRHRVPTCPFLVAHKLGQLDFRHCTQNTPVLYLFRPTQNVDVLSFLYMNHFQSAVILYVWMVAIHVDVNDEPYLDMWNKCWLDQGGTACKQDLCD